jgi:hypothetical protein
MILDRSGTDLETQCDLFVGQASRCKLHDFPLAVGKAICSSLQLLQVSGIVTSLSRVTDGLPYAFEELLLIERLLYKIKRTQLDGPDRDLDFSISSD